MIVSDWYSGSMITRYIFCISLRHYSGIEHQSKDNGNTYGINCNNSPPWKLPPSFGIAIPTCHPVISLWGRNILSGECLNGDTMGRLPNDYDSGTRMSWSCWSSAKKYIVENKNMFQTANQRMYIYLAMYLWIYLYLSPISLSLSLSVFFVSFYLPISI